VARRPALASASPGWRLGTAEFGALGEELAARFLRARRFRLIGRNLSSDEAELDIVALDGDALVVIEVKSGWWPSTPSGPRGHRRPGERVSEKALARRSHAARRLARKQGKATSRVDVLEVVAGRGARAVLLHHRDFRIGTFATDSFSS
jgi:putative endonuclease